MRSRKTSRTPCIPSDATLLTRVFSAQLEYFPLRLRRVSRSASSAAPIGQARLQLLQREVGHLGQRGPDQVGVRLGATGQSIPALRLGRSLAARAPQSRPADRARRAHAGPRPAGTTVSSSADRTRVRRSKCNDRGIGSGLQNSPYPNHRQQPNTTPSGQSERDGLEVERTSAGRVLRQRQ
jgi:hypothetical protein